MNESTHQDQTATGDAQAPRPARDSQRAPRIIEQLRQRAAAAPKRIVFPESSDPRVIEAAERLAQLGLGHPILVCDPDRDLPEGVQAIACAHGDVLEACARQMHENRKHRGLDLATARDMVADDPLLFAFLLVKTGQADASVAGSLASTASVIRAGLYGVGTAPGQQLVSSFFLMQFPDRAVTYADCGVVPDPDVSQLAEIAVTSAASHQQLTGETPRVAMLSFSTKGSAQHPRVAKVRQATERARQLAPELAIDGELQFDAAWVADVARRKAPESPVAGRANVFIFPDLDAGNIAYKITQRLAGAQALGPLVQGLAHPCMDLSRGCSVDDIVDVAVIASILSGTTS